MVAHIFGLDFGHRLLQHLNSAFDCPTWQLMMNEKVQLQLSTKILENKKNLKGKGRNGNFGTRY